ncbi:MAG: mechanosensitive ion channel [Proteobacteria bacterium]|nr:mechanosensitive ion channel [Pseudomonadota bacterium]
MFVSGRWLISCGRLLAPGLLIALLAMAGPLPRAHAEVDPGTAAAVNPTEPAELIVANRPITTLRASAFGAGPAERVATITDGLQTLLQHGGPLVVTARPIPEGLAVLIDGRFLFRILDGDAIQEAGETPAMAASKAVSNPQLALDEIRESRDSEAMLKATGYTVLATTVLAVLLWLIVRGYAFVARRIRAFVDLRSEKLVPSWSRQVVGNTGIADLAVVPVKLVAWAGALLLIYQWTALVLEFFPYTRPWGESLFHNLLGALGRFGRSILHAIPGLLFVALIFFVTRFIVRVVRAFFEGVQAGRINVGWIDETTARPTGRLLTAIIWLFSLVAAYPYIPGSDSDAFKGIGVFVGLMLSIGASGVVNQAVSGLMLMYTKALRPGEFVQVGETEGTVTSVGFLTTRIETLRNVEVTLPNALLVSNVTRNLSRLAANGGMRLTTSVTIGYDTPWRQVHAMLQIAAERTAGVFRETPVRVLQTALQDFYVEYTLVVAVANPRDKIFVLNELHAHIQDVFNEYGVQIMSPNYEADPADKKFVPKEQWFQAPAQATAAQPATTPDSARTQ